MLCLEKLYPQLMMNLGQMLMNALASRKSFQEMLPQYNILSTKLSYVGIFHVNHLKKKSESQFLCLDKVDTEYQ